MAHALASDGTVYVSDTNNARVKAYNAQGDLLWIWPDQRATAKKPGAGVGGHCIPKDPWLLAYGASGGVCGIVFAYLLLFPGAGIALYVKPSLCE